ncbi:2Fe-2S iron-sulfur cluster-binding protein [Marinicella rhabdoformis]|uniref:2Fe-2S iron-sulfur cluster-binding protein n=1 Tax=Marinicella rhabdoformis TaxID=2580566 RepID=UPI0015D09888|nr:2Fe-2S iron-sulfur cluster binding domain-containing protein [Marinicella rhabdoformis]
MSLFVFLVNLSRQQDGQATFTRSKSQVNTAATEQKTLLELAEESDTNPVSGCRMGVCQQCVCRKQQGMVYNTLTESYSDTGAEDIQLCISVAVGDVTLEL